MFQESFMKPFRLKRFNLEEAEQKTMQREVQKMISNFFLLDSNNVERILKKLSISM